MDQAAGPQRFRMRTGPPNWAPLPINNYYNPQAWPFSPPWQRPTAPSSRSLNAPDTCPGLSGSGSDTSSAAIGLNITISFILFLIGMVVFVVATKAAKNAESKPLLRRKQSRDDDWVKTFYSQQITDDEFSSSRSSNETISDVVTDASTDELVWFWKTEEIERRCGKSAAQYLWFMEHVQIFTAIVVTMGVLIILPIDLQGTIVNSDLDFGSTALVNVNPRSTILWVHVSFSLLLFPLSLYFMKLFARKFRGYTQSFTSSKTLMFDHLNPKAGSDESLREHFQEAFPETSIEDIRVTYDTAKLQKLDTELQKCTSCLKYYDRTLSPGDDPPQYAKDSSCVRCCCCCCDVAIDAVEFYSAKALDIENQVQEIVDAPKKITTTFFVTFTTEEGAKQVLSRYRHFWNSLFSPVTSVSARLASKLWMAKIAPVPEYVKWENLNVGGFKWAFYAVILNVALFCFLFFISSPVIILNALGLAQWGENLLILNQVIPALLLVELGLITGGLVRFMTEATRYHDEITKLLVTMKGSFAFTLISQLILPTFGLTSAKALYDYLVSSTESPSFNWACVFLPDSGMVFVSFFIYQSLFGTSMSFSRIVELQIVAIQRCFSRSSAEKYLLLEGKAPFQFETSYSTNIVLVSIVVVFAFIVPYVGPFGLFAIMMNHVAERYNIFFINKVKEVPSKIHKTAVNLFLFSVLFELYIFTFFLAIRSSVLGLGALTMGLVVYTLIFIYVLFMKGWGQGSDISAIRTLTQHLDDEDDGDSYDPMAEPPTYDAPILRRYELLRPMSPPLKQPDLVYIE